MICYKKKKKIEKQNKTFQILMYVWGNEMTGRGLGKGNHCSDHQLRTTLELTNLWEFAYGLTIILKIRKWYTYLRHGKFFHNTKQIKRDDFFFFLYIFDYFSYINFNNIIHYCQLIQLLFITLCQHPSNAGKITITIF